MTTAALSHVWDYPWAQERRCQRCGKTDADLINFGQAAPCQGAPLQPECSRGAGLADQSDKSTPSDEEIGRAAAWLDCTPHAALPLARLLASAREAGRRDERERCARIADQSKTPVPYRWLLTRADDDGNLVGIELDDFQVSFLPERLSLSINITSQQRDMIAAWWRSPSDG